uniref:Uncharacterized protein n=1 Tax=Populus trichocarpa TaxID=3694 RepID=A0A3N7HMF9_POPTR
MSETIHGSCFWLSFFVFLSTPMSPLELIQSLQTVLSLETKLLSQHEKSLNLVSSIQSLLSTKNFDEKNEVPWKITQFIPFCVYFTTRKPAKTNRITDGNISSVIITDGLNSISKSVGIYRPYLRRTIHFVWKDATAW